MMNIRSILGYLTVLLLLPSCSKEDRSTPFAEQKPIQIRAFLQEGDSIRPLGANTRAVDGTLSNGYYIEIAKHNSKDVYLCQNAKVKSDGTLETPVYWRQDITDYRIEAYAFPDGTQYNVTRSESGMSISYVVDDYPAQQEDLLIAGYSKLTVSYDKPVINLYFKHALSRLKFKLIRTAIGPTLYDVSFKVRYVENKVRRRGIVYPIGSFTTSTLYFNPYPYPLGSAFDFLASETKPVDIEDMIMIPQTFSKGGMLIEMSYKTDPADTEYKTLTTDLPTFTTVQGEQVEILLGCDVQIDKLNVQQVTLSPWTTTSGTLDIYK